MRKKLEPWVPAIFCGCISLLTVLGNVAVAFMNGSSTGGVELVFYCFLPMCFYMVGMSLSKLRQENEELRRRIDSLTGDANGDRASG